MIDEDGFLFHLGRADGAISRGGFSIQPEVIERAIRSHPGIVAAAVIGLSHRRLGEVPVAAVQLVDPETPLDIADLERHVRDQVYATHVPTQFRVVRALPLTPSMMVDRGKVRALFEREAHSSKARAK
jgi:acyl-CoA synthetase (AMP-forming)/AMP-acid ligase II